ncbi:hypothetical protein M408DRAFT_136776 [Serendipita vermifera MAFF 305830]|uniref:Activator of Hsp90 ATPase AHSA1-like N-terminal domain-containing protein n=1 Tax=Serendipita vermifera MAFF 305830 TaxID=933852 RepID=A0A0C3BAV8_SERVB|nr:hypothetical protein M408DRAFT_136776 [Serendipita vermifera MAFF 305830]
MAMSSSTANWHWKTKHVSGWAKEWFTSELAGASKQDGSDTITVERLTDFDGDVEIGQRKSKLITIYDCRITLTWSAEGADNTTIKGTIVIPEVSHENTIDGVSDYTYEYSTTSSTGDSKQIGALLARVKSLLPPLLEERFGAFPQALLDTHGKDITVVVASEGNTPSGSGTVTPARVPPTTAKSSTVSSGSTTTETSGVIKTATVKVSSRFMASAEDLWACSQTRTGFRCGVVLLHSRNLFLVVHFHCSLGELQVSASNWNLKEDDTGVAPVGVSNQVEKSTPKWC